MIGGVLVGLALGILGVIAFVCALLIVARASMVLRTVAQENEKLVASVTDLKGQMAEKNSKIAKLSGYVERANGLISDFRLQSANLHVLLAKQHESIVQNEALSDFIATDPAVREVLNRKLKGFIKH